MNLRDKFSNVSSYNRYNKAAVIVDKINNAIDNGDVIIDEEGDIVTGRFESVDSEGSPEVAIHMPGYCQIYLCDTWCDKNLIYVSADDFKLFIAKIKKFKHVKVKDIKRIKL